MVKGLPGGVTGPRNDPGKPRSGEPVNGAKQAASSESFNANVKPPDTTPVERTTQVTPKQQSTTEAQPTKPFETISRNLTMADITNYIVSKGLPNTEKFKQAVLSMIQRGIPPSEENLALVKQLTQGSKLTRDIDAAVVGLSKKLPYSKAVDVLSSFLKQDPKIANRMTQLMKMLSQFRQSLHMHSHIFDQGLLAGLSSVIQELDSKLRKMSKQTVDSLFDAKQLKRSGIFKDMITFQSFLKGLGKQIGSLGKDGQALQETLSKLDRSLSRYVDSYLMQFILSKDFDFQQSGFQENFLYWQIPNPFIQGKSVDMLLRKEKNKKSRKKDDQSRMIFKFETTELGDLGVVVDIVEKDVWFIFQTEEGEVKLCINKLSPELRDRMGALDYRLIGLKTIKKHADIKKDLLPKFDLDSISRVRTEV